MSSMLLVYESQHHLMPLALALSCFVAIGFLVSENQIQFKISPQTKTKQTSNYEQEDHVLEEKVLLVDVKLNF